MYSATGMYPRVAPLSKKFYVVVFCLYEWGKFENLSNTRQRESTAAQTIAQRLWLISIHAEVQTREVVKLHSLSPGSKLLRAIWHWHWCENTPASYFGHSAANTTVQHCTQHVDVLKFIRHELSLDFVLMLRNVWRHVACDVATRVCTIGNRVRRCTLCLGLYALTVETSMQC